MRVSRAKTFTSTGPSSQALGLSSWVELPEVLDVPGVLDRCPVLCLQARGARTGDVDDPERALPHGSELVQPFPGEDPPQDEVARLERPGVDVAAVVSPQRLLVPCRPWCGFAATLLPQYEVHPPRGVLLRFIKCQDPCGAMLDLVR